jgi:hypothetical protein
MTDETDSRTLETVDTAAQKPDSPARRQRTHAVYHFLDKVDAIIKKRCELLQLRQAEAKAPREEPLPLEMQAPPSFDYCITPRGDDELTDLAPIEAPRR